MKFLSKIISFVVKLEDFWIANEKRERATEKFWIVSNQRVKDFSMPFGKCVEQAIVIYSYGVLCIETITNFIITELELIELINKNCE